MRIKQLSLSGTYYTFGKLFGSEAKGEIAKTLDHFKNTRLYKELKDFLQTPKGVDVLAKFEQAAETYCEDVVSELQGVADGAGVTYREMLLLNLSPEWTALFPGKSVPGSKTSVQSKSDTSNGCTDIFLPIPGTKQVYLAHTEDISPGLKECGVLVHGDIYKDDDEKELVESFTEYLTAGILPGSKFGFNKNGLIFGSNNILQKEINLSGIPRKFVFRMITALKDMDEIKNKLATFPGITTAGNFNILYKEAKGGEEKIVSCAFEIAGDTQRGMVYQEHYPAEVYHHCNILKHLQTPCDQGLSTLHRDVVLDNLISHNKLCCYGDLIMAVSNQDDKEFPIFRSGEPPDPGYTAAVAVFDSAKMLMTVYDDKPDVCQGHDFKVPHWHGSEKYRVPTE